MGEVLKNIPVIPDKTPSAHIIDWVKKKKEQRRRDERPQPQSTIPVEESSEAPFEPLPSKGGGYGGEVVTNWFKGEEETEKEDEPKK